MRVNDLLALVEACTQQEVFTPLRVAVTFGFFAFLRISNLAPPTLHTFDHTRHTTFADVVQQGDALVVKLKWTKTRKRSQNAVAIPLPALGNTALCPVRAWNLYTGKFREFQPRPDTPLLVSTEKPQGQPLTIPALRKLFHRACTDANLQDAGYTPHSLRRGGATTAYEAGVTINEIKRHGTWRSDAVESYLFAQPIYATPVTDTFALLLQDYQG